MSNNRQHGFAILAGSLVALLGLQATLAVAQEDEKIKSLSFTASQTFTRDSNLYRASSSQDLQGNDRSDSSSVTRAGVNFDDEFSRQGIHAGVSVSRTLYRNNTHLDNTSPDARLRWDWRLGNHLSGVLGYSYGETFVGFDNAGEAGNTKKTDRVMQRLGRANASADYWWHPDWAVGLGFSNVHSNYRGGYERSKYEATRSNLNFTYRPSTGNRLVFSLSRENGQYPNDPAADWKQNDARFSGQWKLTGVTQLSGYVGYTQRKYDVSNRDFSGTTGSLAFNWKPVNKFLLDLSWRREVGADQDLVSNYAVSQTWALQPTWIVTSKVHLGASYKYVKRKYSGDPDLGIVAPTRDARTQAYGVTLQYLPTETINVALGFQKERRNAEDSDYSDYLNYRAQTVWLSGSFTF
ncbi:MAG: hypothetical protein LBU45_09510 [Azoarcus sp.]|jgi:exopolysaccharide biosynthesis operon protein EpsL|nr:hypothetical protein [Azoarcus sp.]